MNAKKLIATAVLAALSGVALADGATNAREDSVSVRTRAQVRSEVLQARANGQLAPAGEILSAPVPLQSSSRSRKDLQAEVFQARASGRLVVAGEGVPLEETPLTSTLSRENVKSDVLQARAAGELTPAGDAPTTTFAPRRNDPSRPSHSAAPRSSD